MQVIVAFLILVLFLQVAALSSRSVVKDNVQYENSHEKALANWTRILGIATVFLVGATIYNAVVLQSTDEKIHEQVSIANKQLAAMLNDQRPWIKVEGFIDEEHSEGPLDFERNATVPFRTKLTNVGRTPALNVRVQISAFIPELGGNLLDARREFCDGPHPILTDQQGRIIFPSALSVADRLDGWTVPELSSRVKNLPLDKPFSVYIIGCAHYTSPNDRQLRRTTFIYSLVRKFRMGETDRLDRFRRDRVVPVEYLETRLERDDEGFD